MGQCLAGAVLLAAAAALALTFSGVLDRAPSADAHATLGVGEETMSTGSELVPPPKPAFVVSTPKLLDAAERVHHWAPVRRPALARAAPRPRAPIVARLATRTPEGTANVVLALERKRNGGRLWVRIRLPILPNGSTGWVRREALGGYGTVHTRLVVDLSRLEATLHRDGRTILRAPIGVGQAEWPTPEGEFYIRNKLTRYESPFYGPLAFGTSARSSTLTDWPAGGFIGIHGTNRPDLLPGRVSHGCIRLRNQDIRSLARLMPVGTPLTIRS
jgi:lipoprotein-anchoring transpeptidase ErfK/SrfK